MELFVRLLVFGEENVEGEKMPQFPGITPYTPDQSRKKSHHPRQEFSRATIQ